MMRHAISIAAIAGAFALLAILRSTTPDYTTLTGPISAAVRPGETADARNFQASIGAVRLARSVRYRATMGPMVRDTGGMWLIVPATVLATRETMMLSGASWVDAAGIRYAQSRRVDDGATVLIDKLMQPGMARKGVFVFEVPERVALGGTLLVSDTSDPRLDSQVRIALPGADAKIDDTLDLDMLNDGR